MVASREEVSALSLPVKSATNSPTLERQTARMAWVGRLNQAPRLRVRTTASASSDCDTAHPLLLLMNIAYSILKYVSLFPLLSSPSWLGTLVSAQLFTQVIPTFTLEDCSL